MMHMIPNISLTATMRMLLKSPWMPRANVSLIWCRSRHHIAARNPCATLRGCEPPLSTARNPPLRFGCEPKAHIPTPLRLTASPIASLKGCHAEGTRRTATTCHYAADLRRGSGWLLECCMPWRNPAPAATGWYCQLFCFRYSCGDMPVLRRI